MDIILKKKKNDELNKLNNKYMRGIMNPIEYVARTKEVLRKYEVKKDV